MNSVLNWLHDGDQLAFQNFVGLPPSPQPAIHVLRYMYAVFAFLVLCYVFNTFFFFSKTKKNTPSDEKFCFYSGIAATFIVSSSPVSRI